MRILGRGESVVAWGEGGGQRKLFEDERKMRGMKEEERWFNRTEKHMEM